MSVAHFAGKTYSVRKFIEKYTVKLRPITPVHVWSGENAVLGINAFIIDGGFYYLNLEHLDALSKGTLEKVIKIAQERPEGAIKVAFDELYKRGVIAPMAKVRVRTATSRGHVRLMHRNIIPGSTLKGYIRTAVLRKLLVSQPADVIKDLIIKGIDTSTEPSQVSEGLEASLLRKPRTKIQGGFVDVMEMLSVSDPEVVEKDLSLRELRVVHVHNPNDVVARALAIVLDPVEREALKYTITVTATRAAKDIVGTTPAKLEEIIGLRSEFAKRLADRNFILEALREHGCWLLEFELLRLHQSLNDYRALLENIKFRLCGGETVCVPARMGFMAGRESKTVIDLVQKYAPGAYNEVVSLMEQRVKRRWDAMTLKLVDYDGKLVGVGWCELCIE